MDINSVPKRYASYKDINFVIRGNDEEYIFSEVFINSDYQIESNDDLIVFDIGMNVGIASLYFSTLENVKYIYGFEPFKFTYLCALENFDLNPKLKEKIIPLNYGLGNEDNWVKGCIDYTYKGNSSVVREVPWANDQVELVEIRKTGSVLNEFINKHKDLKVFIKIDCEGGEIEIFKDEEFLTILDNIVGITLETHTVDIFNKIVDILSSKNFSISSKILSDKNRFIKAVKL